MKHIKTIKLNSIKEYRDNIKACETLGLIHKLDGNLKQFEYEIVETGSIIGDFCTFEQKIDSMRTYKKFNEKDIKFKHIVANDDSLLPKEDIVELDVIVWDKKFFVLHETILEIYSE